MNKTIELDSGATIEASQAYIRIDSFSGNKDEATIYINTYLSQQNFEDGKQAIEPTKIITFPHSVEDGAPNTVKQGYEYVKTLEEYSDAVDC